MSEELTEKVLSCMEDLNPEALWPTGMKEAIIGFVERCSCDPIIVLDRKKCIEILMRDGGTEEEAIEYFEFNTLGAWMGKGTPCFATLAEDLL